MFRTWLKLTLMALAGCGLLIAMVAPVQADDPGSEALLQRLERLEKQNADLTKKLEALEQGGKASLEEGQEGDLDTQKVQKIVADYLKGQDKQKKDADAKAKTKLEEEGYKVGTDLKMTARWNPAAGVTFETPNKDFVVHPGCRFQLDTVWFNEDEILRSPAQLGEFQDGILFRRVRPSFDGTFWEVGEFNMEIAVESVQQGIVGLDEFWAGITKLPYLGTVRIGHQKIPQGFEGDQVSSSKAMTFLEVSPFTQAFYPNFSTGIWTGNSVLDQHLTWALMAYRQQFGSNGVDFADGEYAYNARITALPVWEYEGRMLLHLGGMASWRKAQKPGNAIKGPPTVGFAARTQARDFSGDFGSGGPPPTLPGNQVTLVNTGSIVADSTVVLGAELFGVFGPFSVQAEYGWALVNNATAAIVHGLPVAFAEDELGFNGGYIQLTYFLTGEHRGYDRRLGREASPYLVGPFTPFWLTRRDGGGLTAGWGAWEVAARYNYLNLNDGVVRGGQLEALEAGLNWYLNPNLKVQFIYAHHSRTDKGGPDFFTGGGGNISGDLDAFGIRTQIFY